MPPPGSTSRRRAAATVLVAAVLGSLVPAGPAVAAGCAQGTGVRVVVDRGPLGGGVTQRCVADGADRPVADVMAAAGVEITWVQRYPGAFVCRLDGRPQDLPCADTPPSDRYWGLFWAAPGDRTWTYATAGAGSLSVPSGGAVGWRFQDGGAREDPVPALRSSSTTAAAAAGTGGQAAGGDADGGLGADDVLLLGLAGLAAAGLATYGVVLARRRRS